MTTAELTKKDILVEALSNLSIAKEADHFVALRSKALAELETLELPTSKTEYWKYTRLGKITGKTFEAGANSTVDPSPFFIPGLEANILVVVNGYFQANLSNIKAQEGITVMALTEAKSSDPTIARYFNQYSSEKGELFMALNNAYHTDGVYIHTAKNSTSNLPYHIINITTGNQVVAQSRNLFVAAQNSALKIIESFVNVDGTENFINNLTEIHVGENAHFEYNKIQDKTANNYSISTEQVYQEANSNFTINTATLNGALVRNNLNIAVDASNCETNLNGLYLGQNKDHIDNHTVVDHLKPHCNSNEVYKGILDDAATGVFNGKVFVRQDAQITNAFQQNNNILLSDTASINSKPELEIYADDVKCSHGSTIGQIDEEAIFYLQSRGLGRRSALNLMINAFAKDALAKISIDALAQFIDAKIEARFGN